MDARLGQGLGIRMSVTCSAGVGLAISLLTRVAQVRSRWVRLGLAVGISVCTFWALRYRDALLCRAYLRRMRSVRRSMLSRPISNRRLPWGGGRACEAVRAAMDLPRAPEDLRATVTVQVGNLNHRIGLHRLTWQSVKFQAMFKWNCQESTQESVQLDDDQAGLNKSLLGYLADEHRRISGDNVVDLFFAAEMHEMVALRIACTHFLCSNMNEKSAISLLPYAIESQLHYLTAVCCQHIADPDQLSESSYRDSHALEDAQLLVETIRSVPKEWEFIPSDQMLRFCAVRTNGPFSHDTMRELKKLNRVFEVEDLIVNDPEILPKLVVVGHTSGFFYIRGFGNECTLRSEEEVDKYLNIFSANHRGHKFVMRALNLTSNSVGTKKATLDRCAPHFGDLFFISIQTDSLENLEVPLATEVRISGCEKLSHIMAPVARVVYANGCPEQLAINGAPARFYASLKTDTGHI